MNTNMAASMVNLQTLRPSSLPLPSRFSIHDRFCTTSIPKIRINSNPSSNKSIRFPVISCCVNSTTEASTISSSPDETSTRHKELPPVQNKRKVYRKLLPGEAEGITEEMRFVAMKLRNRKLKVKNEKSDGSDKSDMEDAGSGKSDGEIDGSDDDVGGTNNQNIDEEVELWDPDLSGFLRYLVDSELLYSSIERLVDESQDVSFAYFRKTGLERSESFRKDIEVFRQENVAIPMPHPPAKKYVKYLEKLATESPPSFFSHLYNIYFAHITGGQVIAKQVSERILGGRELEICKWPGDPQVLLKSMREKFNALGQHWSREVKSRCLREAAKSYVYMGSIIRLIVCK